MEEIQPEIQSEPQPTQPAEPTSEPEPIALGFPGVYAPYDLGDYDERFRGQTILLLRNPSRKFRRDYMRASGAEWLRYVATVCNCTVHQVEELLDTCDPQVLRGVFIGIYAPAADGRPEILIQPQVANVWDAWEEERVKARAAR